MNCFTVNFKDIQTIVTISYVISMLQLHLFFAILYQQANRVRVYKSLLPVFTSILKSVHVQLDCVYIQFILSLYFRMEELERLCISKLCQWWLKTCIVTHSRALICVADIHVSLGFQIPSMLAYIIVPSLECRVYINMHTFMPYNVYKYTLCFSVSVNLCMLVQNQANG